MIAPTSSTEENPEKGGGLIRALVVVAASTCIVLVFSVLVISQRNPYISTTVKLQGSDIKGNQLFRINCAGCHGINGQGLVGPNLHGVSTRRKDPTLIKQIISGKTPPMPSFQMDPQSMSDLISYLHTLD